MLVTNIMSDLDQKCHSEDCKPLTAVQNCSHRALFGLRAAHLNEKVVCIGGLDDGRKSRDEVELFIYIIIREAFKYYLADFVRKGGGDPPNP